MTHPALEYAETELGVHSIYQQALELENNLDSTLTALDKAQDQRRVLDERIEDRELTIVIDERGKHSDMSQAAMDRHLKVKFHQDTELRQLRAQRQEAASIVSGCELDEEIIKSKLRTSQARMVELGGYLQYLASVKLASIQAEKTTQPENQENA